MFPGQHTTPPTSVVPRVDRNLRGLHPPGGGLRHFAGKGSHTTHHDQRYITGSTPQGSTPHRLERSPPRLAPAEGFSPLAGRSSAQGAGIYHTLHTNHTHFTHTHHFLPRGFDPVSSLVSAVSYTSRTSWNLLASYCREWLKYFGHFRADTVVHRI